MVGSEPVYCGICGEVVKRVGDKYECPNCKRIFKKSPPEQRCCKCGRLFLDFEKMADRIQNWIGITKRGLWKSLCPTHRREVFDGMGTVCEVIHSYIKERCTPRDFETDLPEELIKLCLSKMNHCVL